MPRLLSTTEIVEMRGRVHPEFHDDSCEVCAIFSTVSAMVLLLDMRADIDDEPRDDDGRWTSGGGGSINVYATPIVALSDTDSNGGVDDRVSEAVGGGATVQWDSAGSPDIGRDGYTKAMVASNIAAKMDPKYDTQLLGNTTDGLPQTNFLTKDFVWSQRRVGSATSGSWYYRGGSGNSQDQKDHLADGTMKLGDDPTLRSDLREEAVSKLLGRWAGTSNNNSVQSLAMQNAAIKEFNLTGTATWSDPENTDEMNQDMADAVENETAKNGDMYQAFLRAQYDNTQQFFKDNNISTVTAYRGFDFSDGDVMEKTSEFPGTEPTLPKWADSENADEVNDDNGSWNNDISLRPLSSSSYGPDTALIFAGGGDTDAGRVIAGEVPVSRVLSTAMTGLGCLHENEMVLLGGTDKWTIR